MNRNNAVQRAGSVCSLQRLRSPSDALSPDRVCSSQRQRLLLRYPSPGRLLEAYGYGLQLKLMHSRRTLAELAVNGGIPTLRLVGETFGHECVTQWLRVLLENLNAFAGQTVGLSDVQMLELAEIISAEYHWLNLAEMHVFFIRLKGGRYGTFYGSIDPMKITASLTLFVRERHRELAAHESELQRRSRTDRPAGRRAGCVTYEEYLDIRRRADEGDEDALRLLLPPSVGEGLTDSCPIINGQLSNKIYSIAL